MVDTTDLDIEFYNEVEMPSELDTSLRDEADRRIRDLASGHSDIIGASVAIEKAAHGETSYLYEARVVAYVRPENVAAVEKDEDPLTALQGALNALERQIREKRDRLRDRWRQP